VRLLIELLPFHMPKLGDSPRSPDRRGLLFKIGARPSAHRGARRGDGARLIEARVEDDEDESPNKLAAPIAEGGRLEFQRLAFIADLVGFFLPLSFSPGSCTREEDFMVTLTINKDDP
jgi:hypothetical protein